MSALFGRWQFNGQAIDPQDLESFESQVALFGPDGRGLYTLPTIALGYRGFHTTPDQEHQPYVGSAGTIITFDGRLDNQEELVSELGDRVAKEAPPLQILDAAYQAWGPEFFGKLVGEWSAVLWDPTLERLLLAQDSVGTRYLYYRVNSRSIRWSTILEPLIRVSDSSLSLSEEYLAGWLSGYPKPELTPYQQIEAVGPATYISICHGQRKSSKYWEFNPRKTISYTSDQEYEEHFRILFAKAVARRLASNAPVLSELSGGMDSSAIVCMADRLIADGKSSSRLDTLSYFSDSEPHWDDHHYFTIVEKLRGHIGCQIPVPCQSQVELDNLGNNFAFTPASLRHASSAGTKLGQWIQTHGNRVLLSGIGGDELLGGIPTAIPELQDLLSSGHLFRFARQIVAWSLAQRKPLLELLRTTIHEWMPASDEIELPTWVSAPLRKYRQVNRPFNQRIRVSRLTTRPSFRQNLLALEQLRRQLACSPVSLSPLLERRYPYLDRDLLEFTYAIPRQQLLRPGERRSLMRRALVDIVPTQILNRKHKAFAIRTAINAISQYWSKLQDTGTPLLLESFGLIDRDELSNAVTSVRRGDAVPIFQLSRTLVLELWLQHLERRGLLERGGRLAASTMWRTTQGLS